MKKIILTLLIVASFATSFSQTDHKRPASIGVNFFLNDFVTAQELRSTSLASIIRNRHLFNTNRMNPGIALSYVKGLTNHIDFTGTLGGSFVDYPKSGVFTYSKRLLAEVTGALNLKLLPDNFRVVPYAIVGLGASKYKSNYAAFIPVGAGIQFNIFDRAFITVNSQYRVPVTESGAYHFYHSVGLIGQIGKEKVVAPKQVEMPVIEAPKDRDGDGIVDSLDACPDQAGPAALHGCPDRDGDGIADKDDTCPDVPGLARYQGCPIPDTDRDGINDEEDKCPNVPGVARYQGCPIPDTDGDGVNDEEDKCPNEKGPASNFGCPVIEQAIIEKVNTAAKSIFFATGSAKLLAKSYPALNNVVKVLNDNPSFKVDIEGHTDITGTHDKNMVLSDNRAASVKTYLVSKGVDESRITSKGYGPDKPIADNKTAAGKAKNRRVEMKLRNY